MAIIEYRLTELAVRHIRASNSLMGLLMKHFDRGQRTIERMIADQDKRFVEPEVVEIIIEGSGLYREQILEEAVAAA